MAKMMLHDDEARAALGRGVAKLARAVRGTLGPKGMNAIIDRPVGTPIISRDGVSIAQEIELACPFENMGAQVLREVAKQTNDIAGDGTTTATVLADAMVQQGLDHLAQGANAVDLVAGLEIAVTDVLAVLSASARPLRSQGETVAVATIAANDPRTGGMVAEAIERVGPEGIVTVEFGSTVETQLEVVDGMSFDRGYLSHHMVTDMERMQVVLDDPLILMTDLKLQGPEDAASIEALLKGSSRPLLIMAEEVAPNCLVRLLGRRERGEPLVAAIHPPEYGHWRKSMLEDIAIVTGGRVIARELGGRLEDVSQRDLGKARQVRITANHTVISKGGGDQATIAARRAQVARQYEAAPQNIERDKLQERLAKLSGGSATIFAGGATPAEQKRRAQMIEDAVNATRAAVQEGVVAGGGTALVQIAPDLASTVARLEGGQRLGASLLQGALAQPLSCIVRNCGRDPAAVVAEVAKSERGIGFDAQTGRIVDLMEAGVVDPVKVSMTAIRNAASIAALILTTQTLVTQQPDRADPTAGPALGGGAERLGRA
jgi:chaperonin GroEL